MAVPTPEPRVARFEKLAYGMFLHWGLYSLLGRGEWVQHLGPVAPDEYRSLMERFTAEEFDARGIARFAREVGMRYITITARHHDGFSLYDTRGLTDYDAPHAAAGRDLIAEFVEGCRAEDILPVFYHTTLDWTWNSAECDEATFNEYLDYHLKSVEILCTRYGDIGGLWFDGNWSRPDADWKVDRLYEMIRSKQPEAMIVNNTGLQHRGEIGHPMIDSTTYERGLPGPIRREGLGKYVAGEMCETFNRHWGIAANDLAYKSLIDLIRSLAACRKVGANFMMNVGPTGGGAIPDFEAAALRKIGQWVNAHAPAVYDGKPVVCLCEGDDFVLAAGGKLYYFVHNLRITGSVNVVAGAGAGVGNRTIRGIDCKVAAAKWMDNDEPLAVVHVGGGLTVDCTSYPYGTDLVVRVAEITTA